MTSDSSTSSDSDSSSVSILSFEKHTLGIGSRLLSKMGYTRGALRPGGISEPIELKQRPKQMGMQYNRFEEKTLAELQQLPSIEVLHIHESNEDNLIKAQGHEFSSAVRFVNKELRRMLTDYTNLMSKNQKRRDGQDYLKAKHSNACFKLKSRKQQAKQVDILLQSLAKLKKMNRFDPDLLEIVFKSLLLPININRQELMESVLNFIRIENLNDLAALIHIMPNEPDFNKPFHQFLSAFPLDFDPNQLLSFFERIHKTLPSSVYTTMLDKILSNLNGVEWNVHLVNTWCRLCPMKSFRQYLLKILIKPFPNCDMALLESLVIPNDFDTSQIQSVFINYLLQYEVNLEHQDNSKLTKILQYSEIFPNDIAIVLERIWWNKVYTVLRQWLIHGIPNELGNIKQYYYAWKSYFWPYRLPLEKLFYTFLNCISLSIKLHKTNKLMLPQHFPIMDLPVQPDLNLKQGFEFLVNENGLVLDYTDPIEMQTAYLLNKTIIKIENCILVRIGLEWVPMTMKDAIEYAVNNKST